MRNLFIGMIFIFLNFNLTLNTCSIELIPDFIGYFFIMKGLQELEGRSMHFNKVQALTKGMMVYSAILFSMEFLTISARLGIVSMVLGLFAMAGRLYVSYYVVLGVCDLEKESGYRMDCDVLLFRWKIMAFLNICSVMFLMIPVINHIFILASFVFGVMYLVAFNKASNAYIWLKDNKER